MNVRVHSLADRLSELEKRPDYGFLVDIQTELERRVRNITESVNLVLQWQREFAQSQTNIRVPTPPPDLVIPQLPLSEIQQGRQEDGQQTDKSGSKSNGLNEIWAMVGELNLRVKTLTTKEEMNSFIDSVHSRFKLEEAKSRVPSTTDAKNSDGDSRRLAELEQRLLSTSKSLSDLQDDLKQSKQLTPIQLQSLKTTLETRLDELKSSLTSLDRKWLSKFDDLGTLCERRSQVCPYEDDFTMIRSLIMKIRTDMQVIREIQDAQQMHPEEPVLMPTTNLDQISDNPELTAVKSVLQQHDQAIKYISSKVTTLSTTASMDEAYANRQELTQAFHRMDELKQEMVEIMAKQEASKTLSQKDYELLNEIYGILDTKISKEELMQISTFQITNHNSIRS